jgi:hypothetical protein
VLPIRILICGAPHPHCSIFAGAVGPMPIPIRGRPSHQQLLRSASLYVLGERLKRLGAPLEEWLAQTAEDLALTIISAVSVIDFEAIVIDAAFPRQLRARLVAATRAPLVGYDMQGISPFSIIEGSIGSGPEKSAAPACRCSPISRRTARCCSRILVPSLREGDSGWGCQDDRVVIQGCKRSGVWHADPASHRL